jgi:hypothetical protein
MEPFQWAWEREDSENAWSQMMYWDCIFAARLAISDITRLPKKDFSPINFDPLKIALANLNSARSALESVINSVNDIMRIGSFQDALDLGKKLIENPCAIQPRPPIDPCVVLKVKISDPTDVLPLLRPPLPPGVPDPSGWFPKNPLTIFTNPPIKLF